MTTALQTIPRPAPVGPDIAGKRKLFAKAMVGAVGAGLLARKLKKKKEEKEMDRVKEAGIASGMEKAAISKELAGAVLTARERNAFRAMANVKSKKMDQHYPRPGRKPVTAHDVAMASQEAHDAAKKQMKGEDIARRWYAKMKAGK